MENFAQEKIIQDTFFEKKDDNNMRDKIYIKLKTYEKDKLKNAFNASYHNSLNILKDNEIKMKLDKKLIEKIIKNENCEKVLIEKIKEHIEKMKEKEDKYEIKNLNILIVGRRKIGKNDLIKYMLKINKLKKDKTGDFKEYKSNEKIRYNLIKYKGIGYNENNDPEIIKNKTDEFIKRRLETKDPNKFIHCIWYCIKEERIQLIEIEYLKKLKKVYGSDCMPIIMVYLQGQIPDETKNYIKGEINLSVNKDEVDEYFQNMIVKKMKIQNGDRFEIVNTKGDKELFKTTNKLILKAFKGDMQKIMTTKLRTDIKESLKKKNNQIKEIMINLNIKNFINEYFKVLNINKFINYLVNILGRCLNQFFDEKKRITNKSLNLIVTSDNMINIKIMIIKIILIKI